MLAPRRHQCDTGTLTHFGTPSAKAKEHIIAELAGDRHALSQPSRRTTRPGKPSGNWHKYR
jgi:hypothetical protein